MSTLYSIGQMNLVGNAFERAKYSPDDVTRFEQYKKLEDFLLVVNGKATVVPITLPEKSEVRKLLSIDRVNYIFDPTIFIGKGWKFWRGPADGNGLEGDLEQDEKSLALTEVNMDQVLLDTQLKSGESYTTGEERLKRLILADSIRLNLRIFKMLWQNQSMIPESWKGKAVFFDGQILRSPDGDRCALYLYWGVDQWYWDCSWLGDDRDVDRPSAVLAK